MGIKKVGGENVSSFRTSPSLPDYKAMVAINRREEIVERLSYLVNSRPADVVSSAPAANETTQTAPLQTIPVPLQPAAAKNGVCDPPVMFEVIQKLHLAAQKTLDPLGTGHTTLEGKAFLKKLKNFKEKFIDRSVDIANKHGHSLAQEDIALIANDLLRGLSDAAKDLKKWNTCDDKIADSYASFLETLAKFHVTYGSKSHFSESAKRTVDGVKIKNPYIDKPWAGVRSTSDKAISVKAGVGVQTAGMDVSGSLQFGVSQTKELSRDDDDDTLYIRQKLFDAGLSARAKVSAAGFASASVTALTKLRVGRGCLIDAADVRTLMEVESSRTPNRMNYFGHRSSHPSLRKYAEKWRKFAHKTSNMLSSDAFRPDADHHHFLDSRKIFRYSACQAELHSLADDLKTAAKKSMPGKLIPGEAELDDFISTFKNAYPEEEFRVVNSVATSSVYGVTEVDGFKEDPNALVFSSQLIGKEAKAGIAIGMLGEATASASLTYVHKAKVLDFEKLIDSHEILNPVNAGSIERSTRMIEEARRLLTSTRSNHMFKLIDRVITFDLLEGKKTKDCFEVLQGSIALLDAEHKEFLQLQREYLVNPKKGQKAFEKINEKYFDNHYDVAGRFSDPDFQMEFLAGSHDAFSSTLGVICNRLASARQQAAKEVIKSKEKLDRLDDAGKKAAVEDKLDRFDEVAKKVGDSYDALAAKFKSPQSSIPKEERLRCAFFQLPTRLTQDAQVLTSSIGLTLTLPEITVQGSTRLSDVMQYLYPATKMTLGIERQVTAEHLSALRNGSFITLSCEFNAALPYAALIDKAVEEMAESLSNVAGAECEMTGAEQIKFKEEIRRQLTSANAFEVPVNTLGGNMSRRVVMKMRKPIPGRGVPSGDFDGDWKTQYTRVEASTNTTFGMSTPNMLQGTAVPATLSVGFSSSETATTPTSESIGTDVAYNALQFTDGNAWDDKTQQIDFKKLSNFYRNGIVHENKNINKDGKYVAMQLFSDPTCIARVLNDYRAYLDGDAPGSDYALLDTPTIYTARDLYRQTLQCAPGQGTKKSLSECAMSNLDPYKLIKLPTVDEIKALESSFKAKGSPKNMEVYLDTINGQKALTAYFQLMKALNLDKAAYKQGVGFKPCVRPNAVPKLH